MSKDHKESTKEVPQKSPTTERDRDLAQLSKLQTEYATLKKTVEESAKLGDVDRTAKARKFEVVLAMDVIKRKYDLP
jgi:hypothetical protein